MGDANILVLAVDGLRARGLGAYGNTAFSTPALDQFAAESLLFDHCYADSSELDGNYRALWTGRHPLRDESAAPATLARQLAERGYVTTLVSDDPQIADLPSADFDESIVLPDAPPARASEIYQTALGRLFETVCQQLQAASVRDSGDRHFIWAHSRGMYGPWDAPLDLQEPLLDHDEGDPSPYDALEPPRLVLGDEHDPDEVYRISCGYSAQMMALDACVAGLSQLLNDLPAGSPWLVVLCGVRAYPLGEHGQIGGVDDRLFVEQLHVPLLWRFADGQGRLARSGQLASHTDLMPTLLSWVAGEQGQVGSVFDGVSTLPSADAPAGGRDALVAASGCGHRSLRTADWSLRRDLRDEQGEDDSPCRALYVRPDDRWEANDVEGLCPDVVEQLSGALDYALQRIGRGEPLPAQLLAESVSPDS